jgi:hypothetical protein
VPAPFLTVSPGSLSFGRQAAGTTGAAQTVTLRNTGEQPLSIESIGLAGTSAANFAISGDSGEATLAPGEARTVQVTFTPSGAGLVDAQLTIQHNDTRPASPQKVGLSGIGQVPTISLSASLLPFSNQLVGSSSAEQTLTVTNTGQAPLVMGSLAIEGAHAGEFSVTDSSSGTLAPGESRTIGVRFTPAARGVRTASLSISDNAEGSPHRVGLSGTGIAPEVLLSPSSLEFGSQLLTTSNTQSVVLQNVGDAPLRVDTIALAGANVTDFSLASDGCAGQELLPGSICTLNVRFRPAAIGSRSASLVITDNAAGGPRVVPLSGTGGGPSIGFGISRLSTPTTLNFGEQAVGSVSSPQTLTITNTGTAPLTLSSIALAGTHAGEFAILTDTGAETLEAGASRTLTLRFTPGATGTRSASLTITSNVAGSPHTVVLSGTGMVTGGAGSPSLPSGAEFSVIAVDGVATSTKRVVISVGQSVTFQLKVKYPNGAAVELTGDANTRLFANARLGEFTSKSVWVAKPDAAGKTLVFFGRHYSPTTRKPLIDQVLVIVRPVRVRPGRR